LKRCHDTVPHPALLLAGRSENEQADPCSRRLAEGSGEGGLARHDDNCPKTENSRLRGGSLDGSFSGKAGEESSAILQAKITAEDDAIQAAIAPPSAVAKVNVDDDWSAPENQP
jgi:hypothetical protein